MNKSILTILFLVLLFATVFSQDNANMLCSATKDYHEGNFLKAHRSFQTLIIDDEVNDKILSTAKFYSAECLFNLEQFDGAAVEFEQFADNYKNSSFRDRVYYRLGTIYFKRNLFNKSRSRFLTLIDEFPYSEYVPSAYYWIGEGLISENNFLEAEDFFKKAIAEKRNNKFVSQTIYSLASLYERKKQYNNAVDYYGKLLAFHRESDLAPQAQLRIGVCYFKLKEYDSVVLELSDPLIKQLKNNGQQEAKYVLANSFFRLREYDRASEIFKELISDQSSNRNSDNIEFALAWVNFQTGEYEKAFDMFQQLSETATDTFAVKSLYWCAECKRYSNDNESALNIYKNFLEKYPNDNLASEVRFKIGLIYYNQDKIPLAERYLITSIDSEIIESRARAFTLLGEISLSKKDYKSALSYFVNAGKSKLISNELQYRILLGTGVSNYYLGKFKKASSNLLELNSKTKSFEKDKVNFYLAESHFSNGDYENALKHFARVGGSEEYMKKMSLYGMAYSHFNLKDFANSVFYFSEYISLYRRNGFIFDSKRRLAESYYGIKEFTKSSKTYKDLFSTYGKKIKSSFVYYNFAQALFKSSEPYAAIRKLNELQTMFPNSKYADDSQYLIGWIHFQQAEYPQAISNYEKVFTKYTNSPIRPIALYSIGDSYFNLENYDSSIVFYKQLIENYPNTQFVHDAVNGIQYCFMAQDKPNAAIDVIDNFIGDNPDSKYGDKILFKKGDIYFSQGNYELAKDSYQEFISTYSKSNLITDANYWIGKCNLLLNEKDAALENFISVTELNLKSEFGISAVIEICKIYEEKAEFESAISVYNNAIESLPQSEKIPELMYNKGLLQVLKEDLPAAYTTFNNIGKFYSQTLFAAKANIELGLLELKRGGFENSKMLFSDVGSSRTDDIGAEAQYYYGVTLYEEENIVDAISALVRVRSVYPGYIEWYTKSLLKLGDCYIKLNDQKNAREMFRAVLKKHKNNEYAKEANQKLKSL